MADPRFSVECSGAKAKIKSALDFIHDKDFQFELQRELAADMRRIEKRTQGGLDKDYHGFAKYSDSYKQLKATTTASGRKRRKVQNPNLPPPGTTVDLTRTGAMLRGMQVAHQLDITDKNITGELFFTAREAKKARGHIFGNPNKNLPKRNFFGFSKEFIANLRKLIKKFIAKGKR